MKSITQILYLSLVVFALSGCHKLFVDEEIKNTPMNNFISLWKSMDEHYCYFEEKNVDWNAVKNKYIGQIRDGMNDEELFGVCARMIGELQDGHVNLIAPFNLARYWDWYLDYPENFNKSVIERNYLGKDFIITSGMGAGVLEPSGRNIGYMYYESFMDALSEDGMKYLAGKFSNCNGVILDIRNNSGGAVKYMLDLASYLTKEEINVGFIRFKTGKGHADFSDFFAEKIKPASDPVFAGKRIVVLTNRSSYSAANIFPAMMRYFPNVTLIGDRTGGGGASFLSMDMPNGWTVSISSTGFFGMDKKTLEFGVDPDIFVETTMDDAKNGIDAIIEFAMDYLSGR
jgi:hypothetical protein